MKKYSNLKKSGMHILQILKYMPHILLYNETFEIENSPFQTTNKLVTEESDLSRDHYLNMDTLL